MPSRRQFLTNAAILSAAAAVSGLAQRHTTEPIKGKLPPSLAALRSRAAEAKPITADERRQRLERARQLMQQNKLDAIFLFGGTSLVYFTGIDWWNSERLFALVLPQKGTAFFVCPAFEEDRAREQIAKGPLAGDADILTWQEDESPYERVAQGLRARGIAAGNLGIEERVAYVFSAGVAQAAPQLTLASATPVTAGCRMIKSEHELALVLLANQVTLAAYKAAYQALKPGMTQDDFAALVATAHSRLGFKGEASVQVGEYSALPHGSATPQVVREGTILLIDGGCSVEGYASDISRTFVLGKPAGPSADKMRRVFDIVHRAQAAALAAAKPGVEAQSVDAAARQVIDGAGFGPNYAHFTHRLGHGIGMDGHEWPYLVRGDTLALAPAMCFSDEPGIYLRGEFGVRLEDDMHITADGAQLFTPQSPSLEHPFA
ncbi:MAG: Xaa-Pro peptidase family protein [Candidatus Korobacteraceae bacterium]|jgi:Xaa-Pro dipeptidase